ncbi:MAG: hypothetical protein ACIAQ0_13055 [Phycisphaerales bacterium JB058]
MKVTGAMVEKWKGANTRVSLDERRRRLAEGPAPEPASQRDLVRGAIRNNSQTSRECLHRAVSGLRGLASDMNADPKGTVEITRDTLGSIGRLFGGGGEPCSTVMTDRSMAVNLNYVVVPLENIKGVGRKLGGSVNDVFVTAVAGALKRYHEHMGKPVRELRMVMAVNTRAGDESGDKMGNHVATLRIIVPIGIEHPRKRMQEIKVCVRAALGERAVKLFGEIMGVTNLLPRSPRA